MVRPQIMPPRNLVHSHPRHQGLGNNLAFELIGPTTLARRANHDLQPAKLLHMVFYIASQIRLHCKTTLGNGLADKPTIRKVGSMHRLRRDLLARLRYKDLIASGPRSPRPGAPHTFVTTETFLETFDLQSLRDLPELELSAP